MYLVVDIGNSQTCFGVFANQELKKVWRAQTKFLQTADEIASFLLPLLESAQLNIHQIEQVALCSVVPSVDEGFREFVRHYFSQTPFEVQPNRNVGFRFNVDFPGEVGADRIANAAYAIKHLKLPAIVIDFGTATTFDVISREPSYEGGAILPGISLAFQSLGRSTAKLPLVGTQFPKKVIGKNTVECIQGGVLFGYCEQIRGLIHLTEQELGEPASVTLTGGFAKLFADKLQREVVSVIHLTLEGILLLALQERP